MTKKSEDTQPLTAYMASGFVAVFPALLNAVAWLGVSLIVTSWQTALGVSLLSLSISWCLFFFWFVRLFQRQLIADRAAIQELEKTRKEGPC